MSAQHCPGCDGTLHPAVEIISCPGVTCPQCAEKAAEITRLNTLVRESCEQDTDIRNFARPILGAQKTDGDTYGVPGVVDLVESLCAEIAHCNDRIATLDAFAHAIMVACVEAGLPGGDTTVQLANVRRMITERDELRADLDAWQQAAGNAH